MPEKKDLTSGSAKEMPADIVEKVEKLRDKYRAMGQNLRSYLDGLLYADYLTYWDYIRLDVLLNLQVPRTPIKDEVIFIIYHQITELYFKLVLHEMAQLAELVAPATADELVMRLKRINAYFSNLIRSFEIMIDGMDKQQFLDFRMALLPGSGFQSAQWRMIEFGAADLDRLIALNRRDKITAEMPIEEKCKYLYWRQGATELATGRRTLTLKQFEHKYAREFIDLAKKSKDTNIWQIYLQLPEYEQQRTDLVEEMKKLDINANVHWPLMHYRSAVRYLHKNPEDIAATGGTNWQKYLPPKNQRIIFYPTLWSEDEQETWGRFTKEEWYK